MYNAYNLDLAAHTTHSTTPAPGPHQSTLRRMCHLYSADYHPNVWSNSSSGIDTAPKPASCINGAKLRQQQVWVYGKCTALCAGSRQAVWLRSPSLII